MFIGRDGFYWWIGVVEDIEDPLLLGRARIRIFGYHPSYTPSENVNVRNTIPTSELPWGIVILPPNSVGNFSRLALGEWVFGFFLDGPEAQEPAILGYMPTALVEGAVSNSESFGRYPTTRRSFSNLTSQTSPFDINNIDFQALSQRKSFFSQSGHSLQFLDHPNQNFIDIRHNNGRTGIAIRNGEVDVAGDFGSFPLSRKIKEIDDALVRIAGSQFDAGPLLRNFETLTINQFTPPQSGGVISAGAGGGMSSEPPPAPPDSGY
jgi:hypothetical protein